MSADSESVLEVDHIETSAPGHEKVVVRVVGSWRGHPGAPDARAFLVIEADGRRHRFPAMPEPRRSRFGRQGVWAASFAVPAWLEPRLGGQMSLWVGNAAIPLPSLDVAGATTEAQTREEDGDPPRAPEDSPDPGRVDPPPPARVEAAVRAVEAAASAPARDEMIAALEAELKERAATEAQLRGMLAGARAELDARAAAQEQLESAQEDLRAELQQLGALVEDQGSRRAEVESRAVVLAAEVAELQAQLSELGGARDAQLEDLRSELARSSVACAAAEGEAAGLRSELDRLAAELAEARGCVDTGDSLQQAQSLLDDARALSSRLREHGTPTAGD